MNLNYYLKFKFYISVVFLLFLYIVVIIVLFIHFRLAEVRGRLYELMSHLIPTDVIFKVNFY